MKQSIKLTKSDKVLLIMILQTEEITAEQKEHLKSMLQLDKQITVFEIPNDKRN